MSGLVDLDLGVNMSIVDDPTAETPPTATDTGFLIHSTAVSGSPDTVTELKSMAAARAAYPDEMALLACTDTFFGVGGGHLFVIPLEADVEDSLALITPQMGPGQIMAPEVTAEADQVAIRNFGWLTNREYFADTAPDATEAAALAAGTALIAPEGRNAGIWGDTLLISGVAPGSTREVAASVAAAALAGRSDRVTGNPNLAAAGNHTPGAAGQSDYILGIKNERPLDSIRRLAQGQVNSFRTVNKRVRNYGWWTLADLAVHPQWWDISGSRTMMALRAEEQAVAEEQMFGQVAADGLFVDKYKGALSGVCSRYQRIGAIYGTDQSPGYKVTVTGGADALPDLARGAVKAQIVAKTSPFAAELDLTITRRAITDAVA